MSSGKEALELKCPACISALKWIRWHQASYCNLCASVYSFVKWVNGHIHSTWLFGANNKWPVAHCVLKGHRPLWLSRSFLTTVLPVFTKLHVFPLLPSSPTSSLFFPHHPWLCLPLLVHCAVNFPPPWVSGPSRCPSDSPELEPSCAFAMGPAGEHRASLAFVLDPLSLFM